MRRRRAAIREPRRRRTPWRAAPLLVVAGCVTYEVGPIVDVDPIVVAQPVAVPLGGVGSDGNPDLLALDAYYASVVSQMQDAVVERNPELLGSLLAMHDRPVAPEWARARIGQFRRLVRVLEFELHVERAARLEQEGGTPTLGALLPLVLRVAGSPVAGIEVPGEDTSEVPARVLVSVIVVDHDCYGGSMRREFGEILPVERSVVFDDGETLEVPFAVPELGPDGCRRELFVECDLLPGNILLDGELVPNQRIKLGARRFELFPAGIESVRANPYTHLSRGLELGDPEHFDNVFLAAHEMPEEFREDAMRKLVHHLRRSEPSLGRAGLARLCMASLREITGLEMSVASADDRDAWLGWWQERQSH